jgi:hypothetical protein
MDQSDPAQRERRSGPGLSANRNPKTIAASIALAPFLFHPSIEVFKLFLKPLDLTMVGTPRPPASSAQESGVFAVILKGEFHLQGVRNRDLREALSPSPRHDPAQRRHQAARTTRQLRLLRAHGLIYRVGRTYYYRPTQKGQMVMNAALKFRQTDMAPLAA